MEHLSHDSLLSIDDFCMCNNTSKNLRLTCKRFSDVISFHLLKHRFILSKKIFYSWKNKTHKISMKKCRKKWINLINPKIHPGAVWTTEDDLFRALGARESMVKSSCLNSTKDRWIDISHSKNISILDLTNSGSEAVL
jgi:hypothetical protein